MTRHTTADLNSTLLDWGCPTDVADAVRVLAAGGARLADAIADQRFPSNPQPDDGVAPEVLNGGNDVAHALDVHAHDLFVAALRGTSTRALVSEEAHEMARTAIVIPDSVTVHHPTPLTIDQASQLARHCPPVAKRIGRDARDRSLNTRSDIDHASAVDRARVSMAVALLGFGRESGLHDRGNGARP